MDQSILHELTLGPKTIGELAYRLDAPQTLVLHHVQILKMQEKVVSFLTATDEVWSLS